MFFADVRKTESEGEERERILVVVKQFLPIRLPGAPKLQISS